MKATPSAAGHKWPLVVRGHAKKMGVRGVALELEMMIMMMMVNFGNKMMKLGSGEGDYGDGDGFEEDG